MCLTSYGRWYLGIQSKKDPAHVMNEVYKAMQALQCVWHQVNNYRVLCLWKYTSGIMQKPPSPSTLMVMTRCSCLCYQYSGFDCISSFHAEWNQAQQLKLESADSYEWHVWHAPKQRQKL